MRGWSAFLAAGAAALLVSGGMAAADPLPRAGASAGSVIARKAGEEARFIEIGDWQTVDLRQDLLAGDVLRTNAGGSLAILFSDRTQVRLGRNSTLVVRKVGGDGTDTELALESGQLWGRAARGGEGVAVATPAATAAIRGTDWSMQVGGGSTTLSVFEGRVELANPQGAVVVAQGEGARAAVGQAPSKYILVNPDEREQILFFSEKRTVFSDFQVSGSAGPLAREQRARFSALAPAALSPAERVSLAESLFEFEGREAAKAALKPLVRPARSRALEARALLLEALLAGAEGRYAEAEALFARAQPGLPEDRRATAAYGRWFAASLARPDDPPPPLPPARYANDPSVVRAAIEAATGGENSAETLRRIEEAEKRFPDDASLPAAAVEMATVLGRRDEAEAALARARRIDPDGSSYLLSEARFRTSFLSDLDGARSALLRALELEPGNATGWGELGNVEADRRAVREADAAYRRAVALDPESPAFRANYANFLLGREQLAAAKQEIDRAEAIDPSSYAVLAVKGRYLLRLGRTEEGRDVLLQATAVNPTYSDALGGQAVAAYQIGAVDEAAQAIDNADRFDKESPSAALIRTAIALDEYRADDAVASARDALARRQARGGYFSTLRNNRQAGSFLGVALDFIELDEWGSFYRDRAFDPFLGSSYIDEAVDGRLNPFAGTPALQAPDARTVEGSSGQASRLQATLLDPFSIAGRTRRSTLDSQAFNEVTVGGGALFEGGVPGWRGDVTAQGQGYFPLPYAYSVQAEIARPDGPRENDTRDIAGGFFTVGLKPTLTDNVAVYGASIDSDSGFPGQAQFPSSESSESRVSNLGVGWSHVLGDRNVLQAFVSGARRRNEQNLEDVVAFFDLPTDPDGCFDGEPRGDFGCYGPYTLSSTTGSDSVTAGASHMIALGPATLRYGTEANWERYRTSDAYEDTDGVASLYESADDSRSRAARIYGDVLWQPTSDFAVEAGLWATRFTADLAPLDYVEGLPPFEPIEDPVSVVNERTRLDGRLGLAWSPAADHYLRAFYREDTQFSANDTLAPISTVGLAPLDLPLFSGGETRTLGLRWDAEWSERFFTSVGYQHIEVDGLTVDTPGLLTSSFFSSRGEIDRLDLAANWWIGNGFGAFATVALNDSRDADYLDPLDDGGFTVEDGLPLVPDYLGRVGITYVSPYLFKATVAQTFVGRRVGDPFGITIDPYTTTDAALTFLAADRHLEFEVQALNLFDEDFELALGVPGPGQTFSAVLRARF